jgi:nucleotide-binding universal stress UspA family protein
MEREEARNGVDRAQAPGKNGPMTKPKHVLVATDLSAGSDEALRRASEYARLMDAKLTALHVVPDYIRANPLFPQGSTEDIDTEVDLEKRGLDDLAARVSEVTFRLEDEVTLAVRIGAADVEAVRYAEKHDVDVIVVGATGRTGLSRLLLGSVAERIVRYAHCPVLVARATTARGVVLAATDLSQAALAAVERARSEASFHQAKLELMHVIDFAPLAWQAAAGPLGGFGMPIPPEKMDEMRRLAVEALRALGGPDAGVHVTEGSPRRAIVARAEEVHADLVVVGTHGRTGLARMALGSVAETVVRSAPCSVLVVRPYSLASHAEPIGNFEG